MPEFDKCTEIDSLLQVQLRSHIEDRLGKEDWIILSNSNPDVVGIPNHYSVFAPNSAIKELLNCDSWDISKGNGFPSEFTYYDNGQDISEYQRYGNNIGLEPIIFSRSFTGVSPPNLELSEEFRYFHNLYYDIKNKNYVNIDNEGKREVEAIIKGYMAKVRKLYLYKYMAKRNLNLVLYFECFKTSKYSLAQLGLNETRKEIKKDNLFYSFFLNERSDSKGNKSMSGILGKKIIQPPSITDVYPEINRKYETFIIGKDDYGVSVNYTCEPIILDKYDHRQEKPIWLTPIHFSKDVLSKYYADTNKYQVGSQIVKNKISGWSLQVDSAHEDRVIVFLGYLGRDLPFEEQKHWKSYNISPEGGLSRQALSISLYGIWTEPEIPDFRFKAEYERANNKWACVKGWSIYKPLRCDDKYKFEALHIPLSENQDEFEDQVENLAIVLVDSLNEEGIKKNIQRNCTGLKGIQKLEAYFQENNFSGFENHISFLRQIMNLRTGTTHRKGVKYDSAYKCLKIEDLGYTKGFVSIINKAINYLQFLDKKIKGN